MKQKIKDFYVNALVDSAVDRKRYYDPVTGRFMSYVVHNEDGTRIKPEKGKGWAIFFQDDVLGFAYLYHTPYANNPFYKDPETYELICKAVQAWRDFQNEDGTMEFIKPNGDCFGPIYMPWSWYHWLETYAVMRDALPEAVRADWEAGLTPGLESYAKQDPTDIHNIPVWQAMCVHRAGKLFGRQDWVDAGSALIENACKEQHPDGFWPEFQGPCVGYNNVYLRSIALYYLHGGKADVLPAIKRAMRFTKMFTYPGGTSNDTIDGRQHYLPYARNSVTTIFALPAFTITESGIAYLASMLTPYLAAATPMYFMASLLLALDSDQTLPNSNDDILSDAALPDFSAAYGKATIVRKNNSQVTLSAYTAPLTESRWGMDRQFFASVWTGDADLLMGSANSKNQIELSTFVISDENGKTKSWIPSAGEVVRVGEIALGYDGHATCSITGDVSNNGTLSLTYAAKLSDPTDRWRVSLPLNPNFEEKADGYRVCMKDGRTCIEYKGWRVSFTGDYKLHSPLRPFNPYYHSGECEIENDLLVVNIYPEGDSLTVTFEKIDESNRTIFADDNEAIH